jgi:hypothetical protein
LAQALNNNTRNMSWSFFIVISFLMHIFSEAQWIILFF